MVILFLHQNFPGQFAHLAPALAAAGHRVVALTSRFEESTRWRGVEVIAYRYDTPEGRKLHPWSSTFDSAVDRGATVFRACEALKARGLNPDVIVAHSGWGEALFLRHVWPGARIGVFAEFFYQAEGADIGFDPELAGPEIGRSARVEMKNLAMRLQLETADAAITPTHWQAEMHPPELRRKISVAFDGIDTDAIRPDARAELTLPGHGTFRPGEEIVTFVNRNLEPYRGFHVFMRALPDLLRARPQARVVIVGEDGVSYGTPPASGGSWKQALLDEVRDRIPDADWARVHFTGRIGREDFTRLLQVSRVHVYLTYPFVLSWSLIEAMSAGCAIVASDTAPVREAIRDGENGLLFDFFDGQRMVALVDRLMDDPAERIALGQAARQRAVQDYDLQRVCLPAQFRWIEAQSRSSA
ncbi:Glycosyltransferase involved in cell wall bisynthesis [Palleronia marisminoris]|uniref:Glycogen synthase n=1 Tax=Palleronia marisminoris TaxID=315423 RepID=A0A1Y5SKS6_9RHOB|nr:glycosyltransferase [Palleronia marisminoris]SFG87341.1 Glycosyltransferase involved in cell wall bisynthesis [Palleronia marisminoris]SLN43067.1 Glycogen synthase [Palleronia marisminoris]